MSELGLFIDGAERAAFRVHRFALREQLSEPPSLRVVASSRHPDLDLDAMIWKPASFTLDPGWAFVAAGGARAFTGLCWSAEQLSAEASGISLYSLCLAPRFSLLGLRRDYRIYQHLRVPTILTQILERFAVHFTLQLDPEAFPVLDYKVQYGESDLVFFTRLCEEAGITFFFRHEERRGTVLVLCDAPEQGALREGAPLFFASDSASSGASEREHVRAVRLMREAHPLSVALRDFDFRNPALPLCSRAGQETELGSLLEQMSFEPGAFRRVLGGATATPLADRRGATRHEPKAGHTRAAHRLLGERRAAETVTLTTNALDLTPGVVFSLDGHPHPALGDGAPLLVTASSIEGERDKEWVAQVEALSAEEPYRPLCRTPRPVVPGLQSALVTGPRGDELFTDEHGRVRVRFVWDRADTPEEERSTWVRVSQGWAGAGYGLWTLPRVGQEVLVGFFEGNPDEPVIVGRAPNAHNPAPYPLPAGATKTVWRSRSTPGADGFNEISFDDDAGRERFFQRAQKDMETQVLGDEALSVGGRRRQLVKGDWDVSLGGTLRERVGGAAHRTVDGERRELVGGCHSLVVGGDRMEQVGGTWAAESSGPIHLVSSQSIVLEAPDITLKGAGGFVRVGPSGVTTPGGWVIIQPGGPGAGPGADPAMPELPGLGRRQASTGPKPVRRLPVLGFGPVFPGALSPGIDKERGILCAAMCACKDARVGTNGKGPNRQTCVAGQLWALDDSMDHESTIKAEVPYDMSRNPPAPIMSKNEPKRPTRKKPGGSKIPDVVIVKDPTKPPTQDNLERIIEMKFPGDKEPPDQIEDYRKIGGRGKVPVETMTLDDCHCGEDKERERVPLPIPGSQKQPQTQPQVQPGQPQIGPMAPGLPPVPKPGTLTPEQAEALAIIALILALLVDDATGVGVADDAAIPLLLGRLGKLLGI